MALDPHLAGTLQMLAAAKAKPTAEGTPEEGRAGYLALTAGSLFTIPGGATRGTVQVDSRPDDVYQQGDTTVQVGIGGTTGGNYEQLNTSSTTNTVVADDADVVRITLTGPESVVEGGSITVTAHVEQPPQGSDLVITLTNGQVITIAAGATTGTVSYVPLPDDNVTQGERPVQGGIAGSTGGNYENPVLGGAIDFTVKDNDSPPVLVGDAGRCIPHVLGRGIRVAAGSRDRNDSDRHRR